MAIAYPRHLFEITLTNTFYVIFYVEAFNSLT